MWGSIKKMFSDDAAAGAQRTPLDEARVCAAALLVEAALSDGIYATVESEQIIALLRDSFALDDAEARAILEEAETRAEQAADQQGFTREVKILPLEERERLVEGLWRVVFADGEEAPEEQAMVSKLADLLHVDPRQSRLARRRVADDGGAAS